MSYRKPGSESFVGIIREADGAFIPADPTNADWQAYQAWVAAGNAPTDPKPTSAPAAANPAPPRA